MARMRWKLRRARKGGSPVGRLRRHLLALLVVGRVSATVSWLLLVMTRPLLVMVATSVVAARRGVMLT